MHVYTKDVHLNVKPALSSLLWVCTIHSQWFDCSLFSYAVSAEGCHTVQIHMLGATDFFLWFVDMQYEAPEGSFIVT
jgi:hypothetical protein